MSLQGVVTIQRDIRPPFIQAKDLDKFWDCMEKISRDQFNNQGNITLDVENIIINDKTYKGPTVLTPEDIETKNMNALEIKKDDIWEDEGMRNDECCVAGTKIYEKHVSEGKRLRAEAEKIRPMVSPEDLDHLLREKDRLETLILEENIVAHQEALLDVREKLRFICCHTERDDNNFCNSCGVKGRPHYNYEDARWRFEQLTSEALESERLAEENLPVEPPSKTEWEELKTEAFRLRGLPEPDEDALQKLKDSNATLQRFCTHISYDATCAEMLRCPLCDKQMAVLEICPKTYGFGFAQGPVEVVNHSIKTYDPSDSDTDTELSTDSNTHAGVYQVVY